MSQDNKQIVRRFVEVGNRGEVEALDDILAPDFVRHCQATPDLSINSCEEFKQFYRDTAATFPDQEVVMDVLVAEGDLVAFFGAFTGTQKGPMGPFPASGKRIDSKMAGVFRVHDNRIAELWVTWDNMAGLAQLGHLPPPSS